jgi:HSP20 family protein
MPNPLHNLVLEMPFGRIITVDSKWQPEVNIYASLDGVEVCMDLAGVRKQDIKVEVQQRRLIVRGHRDLPTSSRVGPQCSRILVMEITDGRFERILDFPMDLDMAHVEARKENGWLWISLPTVQ